MAKTKDRPIILHPHEIRAALEGRLGQIRRPIEPQPRYPHVAGYVEERPGIWTPWEWFDGGRQVPCNDSVVFPYGKPGDRLWVRETWQRSTDTNGLAIVVFQADGSAFNYLCDCDGEGDPVGLGGRSESWALGPWRPSIHMPRWASRIHLEVTEVRVERLQDISEEDAIASGIQPVLRLEVNGQILYADSRESRIAPTSSPAKAYGRVWDARHAKKGLGWDTNPWTVVYRVKTTTGEGR